MPAQKLTAKFCESVKPVPGRQVAYPDLLAPGLELRVSGEGRKTWSYRYRTHEGRQGRLTLGVFSQEFDLERARREAAKVRVLVDGGGDPADERRANKQKAKAEPIRTFDDLAVAYFAACERGEWRPKNRHKRESTLRHERNVYKLYLKPALGKMRPEAITRATVRNVLRGMIDRGITSRTNRAHAIARQIFTFAVAEERLSVSPVVNLPPLAPEKPRARVYTDDELRALWAGIKDPASLAVPAEHVDRRRDGERVFVGPGVRIALQLCMMLLQRRGEVAGMALSELDLDHGVWIIPPERMKTGRPNAVPLSPRAVALIREAIALNADRPSAYVFRSRLKEDRPINGAALNHALKGVQLCLGIKDGTVHDLRRTGATLMTSERLGISPFIRSKVLGHIDSGGGSTISATHYDVNSYMPEKRRALEAWEALLFQIVEGVEIPSNVRTLARA